MLLIDFSQISVACYMAITKGKPIAEVDLIRHTIIEGIRGAIQRFPAEATGGIIIAIDSTSWRTEVFPLYKKGRKKNRAKTTIDWGEIYSITNMVQQELNDHTPFTVIKVPRAEADDIIAVLTLNRRINNEPVAIISSDHDHIQLHVDGVSQISPITKKAVTFEYSRKNHILEHIIRGDTGDGIPNIFSDDDTFVTDGKRQKQLSTTKLVELVKNGVKGESSKVRRNFDRNKLIIDYTCIPSDLVESILKIYDTYPHTKGPQDLMRYFVDHKLSRHAGAINSFVPRDESNIPAILRKNKTKTAQSSPQASNSIC